MKLNYWRISAKTVLVAVLVGGMSAYEQTLHPIVSAQKAVAQLADTELSTAQMTAYSWFIPTAWSLIALVAIVLVYTEVRAIVAANTFKEEAVR